MIYVIYVSRLYRLYIETDSYNGMSSIIQREIFNTSQKLYLDTFSKI